MGKAPNNPSGEMAPAILPRKEPDQADPNRFNEDFSQSEGAFRLSKLPMVTPASQKGARIFT